MWVAIIGIAIKLFVWFHDRTQRLIGRTQERAEQAERVIRDVEEANRTRSDVGRDPELDKRLRDLDR